MSSNQPESSSSEQEVIRIKKEEKDSQGEAYWNMGELGKGGIATTYKILECQLDPEEKFVEERALSISGKYGVNIGGKVYKEMNLRERFCLENHGQNGTRGQTVQIGQKIPPRLKLKKFPTFELGGKKQAVEVDVDALYDSEILCEKISKSIRELLAEILNQKKEIIQLQEKKESFEKMIKEHLVSLWSTIIYFLNENFQAIQRKLTVSQDFSKNIARIEFACTKFDQWAVFLPTKWVEIKTQAEKLIGAVKEKKKGESIDFSVDNFQVDDEEIPGYARRQVRNDFLGALKSQSDLIDSYLLPREVAGSQTYEEYGEKYLQVLVAKRVNQGRVWVHQMMKKLSKELEAVVPEKETLEESGMTGLSQLKDKLNNIYHWAPILGFLSFIEREENYKFFHDQRWKNLKQAMNQVLRFQSGKENPHQKSLEFKKTIKKFLDKFNKFFPIQESEFVEINEAESRSLAEGDFSGQEIQAHLALLERIKKYSNSTGELALAQALADCDQDLTPFYPFVPEMTYSQIKEKVLGSKDQFVDTFDIISGISDFTEDNYALILRIKVENHGFISKTEEEQIEINKKVNDIIFLEAARQIFPDQSEEVIDMRTIRNNLPGFKKAIAKQKIISKVADKTIRSSEEALSLLQKALESLGIEKRLPEIKPNQAEKFCQQMAFVLGSKDYSKFVKKRIEYEQNFSAVSAVLKTELTLIKDKLHINPDLVFSKEDRQKILGQLKRIINPQLVNSEADEEFLFYKFINLFVVEEKPGTEELSSNQLFKVISRTEMVALIFEYIEYKDPEGRNRLDLLQKIVAHNYQRKLEKEVSSPAEVSDTQALTRDRVLAIYGEIHSAYYLHQIKLANCSSGINPLDFNFESGVLRVANRTQEDRDALIKEVLDCPEAALKAVQKKKSPLPFLAKELGARLSDGNTVCIGSLAKNEALIRQQFQGYGFAAEAGNVALTDFGKIQNIGMRIFVKSEYIDQLVDCADKIGSEDQEMARLVQYLLQKIKSCRCGGGKYLLQLKKYVLVLYDLISEKNPHIPLPQSAMIAIPIALEAGGCYFEKARGDLVATNVFADPLLIFNRCNLGYDGDEEIGPTTIIKNAFGYSVLAQSVVGGSGYTVGEELGLAADVSHLAASSKRHFGEEYLGKQRITLGEKKDYQYTDEFGREHFVSLQIESADGKCYPDIGNLQMIFINCARIRNQDQKYVFNLEKFSKIMTEIFGDLYAQNEERKQKIDQIAREMLSDIDDQSLAKNWLFNQKTIEILALLYLGQAQYLRCLSAKLDFRAALLVNRVEVWRLKEAGLSLEQIRPHLMRLGVPLRSREEELSSLSAKFIKLKSKITSDFKGSEEQKGEMINKITLAENKLPELEAVLVKFDTWQLRPVYYRSKYGENAPNPVPSDILKQIKELLDFGLGQDLLLPDPIQSDLNSFGIQPVDNHFWYFDPTMLECFTEHFLAEEIGELGEKEYPLESKLADAGFDQPDQEELGVKNKFLAKISRLSEAEINCQNNPELLEKIRLTSLILRLGVLKLGNNDFKSVLKSPNTDHILTLMMELRLISAEEKGAGQIDDPQWQKFMKKMKGMGISEPFGDFIKNWLGILIDYKKDEKKIEELCGALEIEFDQQRKISEPFSKYATTRYGAENMRLGQKYLDFKQIRIKLIDIEIAYEAAHECTRQVNDYFHQDALEMYLVSLTQRKYPDDVDRETMSQPNRLKLANQLLSSVKYLGQGKKRALYQVLVDFEHKKRSKKGINAQGFADPDFEQDLCKNLELEVQKFVEKIKNKQIEFARSFLTGAQDASDMEFFINEIFELSPNENKELYLKRVANLPEAEQQKMLLIIRNCLQGDSLDREYTAAIIQQTEDLDDPVSRCQKTIVLILGDQSCVNGSTPVPLSWNDYKNYRFGCIKQSANAEQWVNFMALDDYEIYQPLQRICHQDYSQAIKAIDQFAARYTKNLKIEGRCDYLGRLLQNLPKEKMREIINEILIAIDSNYSGKKLGEVGELLLQTVFSGDKFKETSTLVQILEQKFSSRTSKQQEIITVLKALKDKTNIQKSGVRALIDYFLLEEICKKLEPIWEQAGTISGLIEKMEYTYHWQCSEKEKIKNMPEEEQKQLLLIIKDVIQKYARGQKEVEVPVPDGGEKIASEEGLEAEPVGENDSDLAEGFEDLFSEDALEEASYDEETSTKDAIPLDSMDEKQCASRTQYINALLYELNTANIPQSITNIFHKLLAPENVFSFQRLRIMETVENKEIEPQIDLLFMDQPEVRGIFKKIKKCSTEKPDLFLAENLAKIEAGERGKYQEHESLKEIIGIFTLSETANDQMRKCLDKWSRILADDDLDQIKNCLEKPFTNKLQLSAVIRNFLANTLITKILKKKYIEKRAPLAQIEAEYPADFSQEILNKKLEQYPVNLRKQWEENDYQEIIRVFTSENAAPEEIIKCLKKWQGLDSRIPELIECFRMSLGESPSSLTRIANFLLQKILDQQMEFLNNELQEAQYLEKMIDIWYGAEAEGREEIDRLMLQFFKVTELGLILMTFKKFSGIVAFQKFAQLMEVKKRQSELAEKVVPQLFAQKKLTKDSWESNQIECFENVCAAFFKRRLTRVLSGSFELEKRNLAKRLKVVSYSGKVPDLLFELAREGTLSDLAEVIRIPQFSSGVLSIQSKVMELIREKVSTEVTCIHELLDPKELPKVEQVVTKIMESTDEELASKITNLEKLGGYYFAREQLSREYDLFCPKI